MAPRAWLFLTLAGAGLATAPASQAAVFAMVRAEPDTITVMDPAAVEAVPGAGNLRRAYSVTVQKTLVSDGPQQPGYVRTLNEYDCAARMIRWKSFSVYSRFGDLVIHKDNADQTWSPTPPGSEAEASTRLVCDHANKWSARGRDLAQPAGDQPDAGLGRGRAAAASAAGQAAAAAEEARGQTGEEDDEGRLGT